MSSQAEPPLDLERFKPWLSCSGIRWQTHEVAQLVAEVERLRTFCDHMGDNDHDVYGDEIEFNCAHCGAHVRGVLDWDDRPCDVWRSVEIIPGVLR